MNNQKQFGIWMDSHHAIIVGKADTESTAFEVIAQVNGGEVAPNSSEKTENNDKKMLQSKFFKEILTHMQNATHVYVTGTGTAQEQFIHYMEATPQFKNTKTAESTSNKMSDERLVEFFADKIK